MSSSKGNSNSNKTAHVMNLLRKSNPAPVQSEAAEQPVPAAPAAADAPAAAPAPAPQTPPIITALNADAEVSSQIKAALTEALEEEERAAVPSVPHPEHIPASAPKNPPAAEPVQAEIPAEAPVEAPVELPTEAPMHPAQANGAPAEDAPAAPMQEAIPAPPAAPSADVTAQPGAAAGTDADNNVLINAVQSITQEKVDKYIRLFGLCSCSHCRSDVLAITLNNLPPQYVVMPQSEFQIRSDMYAKRYDGEITTQILRACQIVMDHPRH